MVKTLKIAFWVLVALAVLWLVHYWSAIITGEVFRVLGSRAPTGAWYGFWSGFGGSAPDIVIITGFTTWYLNHTCHMSKWCLRWGKYEAAGGMFKLCHAHHPDIVEHAHLSRKDMIHKLHREHKERQGALPVVDLNPGVILTKPPATR
jgi:hypothetical protein